MHRLQHPKGDKQSSLRREAVCIYNNRQKTLGDLSGGGTPLGLNRTQNEKLIKPLLCFSHDNLTTPSHTG